MGKFIDQTKLTNNLTVKVSSAVHKYVAVLGCNVGVINIEHPSPKILNIDIENDGQIAADLARDLGKMDRVVVISHAEYPDSYDWRADVYCRPSSSICLVFQ